MVQETAVQRICDRCGAERTSTEKAYFNEWSEVVADTHGGTRPVFGHIQIDLCPECVIGLTVWFKVAQ